MELNVVFQVPKAWEDNICTHKLENSTSPLMTPRTKHIDIKYSWFRSKIKPNEIEVVRVSTNKQQADLFTKRLTRFPFEHTQKSIMEW